ncbi:MAG: aminotransferase class I/II-fold pyridoxal phosphate-dependent enzyme [Candidatus Schekmanbacteria bacterium]|nr:aminotransferase class I/II-fold pyridoxal phosphate-dependent enzyme [Candidatus Schekmanbacteria bacterium]
MTEIAPVAAAPPLASVPLAEPFLGAEERALVLQCLDDNCVSSVGPFVGRFEEEFARLVGARHAVACASGTAALHLAAVSLGLGQDDEVWAPTFTFAATVNPFLYERCRIVLFDSEPETWNVDSELMLAELSQRRRSGRGLPRAIVVAHIYGHPARLTDLAATCRKLGIVLIEDACEAVNAFWIGRAYERRHVGSVGDAGCFSFNGNKLITSGGGGMLVTDSDDLARLARHLSTQARIPGAAYWHDRAGYNYRLTNIAAALGLGQLRLLPEIQARKRIIVERYAASLRGLPGIVPPPRFPWALANDWLFTVLVDATRFGAGRDVLLAHLAKKKIDVRPTWTPLHTLPYLRGCPFIGGAVALGLAATGLSLPSSAGLTEQQQARVIAALRELAADTAHAE